MKPLYRANDKYYKFVEYTDDFHEGCTKYDLLHSDAPCGGGYFIENKEEKIMNNTKKPHIHAEVIKAWAEGATVEYFDTFDNEWIIAASPAWKQDTQYRVKPEPTYPETRLTGDELHSFWYNIESIKYEDFIALSNHVIKDFIVSGQMDEYIKERNN